MATNPLVNKNTLLQRVSIGGYAFLALIEETLEKPTLIVQHNVQSGLPASQFGRTLPKSGSLTIVLMDGVVAQPISILTQKAALDGVANIRAQGGPVQYYSPWETVPSVVIENLQYKRDKQLNVWGVTVSWKEVRVTSSLTSALPLQGNIDPATRAAIDAPFLSQGDTIMPETATTASSSAGTKKSKSGFKSFWRLS